LSLSLIDQKIISTNPSQLSVFLTSREALETVSNQVAIAH
jgi:hypothetical protein